MTETGLPVLAGGVPPEVAYLRLPRAAALFGARAARLRVLAEGHAAGEWLLAMAAVCDAQRQAVLEVGRLAPAIVDFSPMAPLSRVDWEKDDGWLPGLRTVIAGLGGAVLPPPARLAVGRLLGEPRERLGRFAAMLAGAEGKGHERPDPASALVLGAAMSVHLCAAAEHLPAERIARAERDCPVCAAPAACGLVMGDDKVRYLHCALCGSAWHKVRVQCATCGSAGGTSYYSIEGGPDAKGDGADRAVGARAEACSDCHTYLKLFYQEERPETEPLADDLATLSLDLLVGEAGFARGGLNPYLAV